MSGESTSADICKDAVSVTYDGIPGYDTDVVVQTICSDGATAAIDQVFTDNSMSSLTVQVRYMFYYMLDKKTISCLTSSDIKAFFFMWCLFHVIMHLTTLSV
jgi:hypothetical protein